MEPESLELSIPSKHSEIGGLQDLKLTGVVHRYQSKRWWHRIDVEFNDSEVLWTFHSQGSQWRERLPLSMLVPYPATTTDNRPIRNSLVMLIVSCTGTCFLAWLDSTRLDVSPGTIIAGICACLNAAYLAWCWWRGPMEWVNFASSCPGKTIYYWQTAPGDAFQTFTDRLKDAILAATRGAMDHALNADKPNGSST